MLNFIVHLRQYLVTCCMQQLALIYYCACFCETCTSALVGARFFGQVKKLADK